MAHLEIERSHDFAADAEQIWPAIARTNLLSELVGPGRYEAVEVLQADGSVLRHAVGDKLHPLPSSWTEDLGEWVYARYCGQRRWFVPDGSQFVEYIARLEPRGATTRVRMRIEIVVAKPLIWLGIQLGMVPRAAERVIGIQVALIEAEIARAGDAAARHDPLAHLPLAAPPPLTDQSAARLAEVEANLRQWSSEDELITRLLDFLRRAPDDFLGRIRPLELARAWGADPDRVVDLFLAAHHARLLSLRWEILCPRCRNDSRPLGNLDALPRQVHCPTCNVDYERDFSANVELLFAPEPWLRPLPQGAACMLGASSAPHILVQRHVDPGGERVIDPPLQPGTHRVRAPQLPNQHDLPHEEGAGFPTLTARHGQLILGEPAEPGQMRLVNQDPDRVTFVVEELAWRRGALTGDQAIARAAFRRYCPDQLLRPGDDVRIANVVVMFTDLQRSTSLYEAIGDPAAYKLVRDHFDYLGRIIEAGRGSVVKTMGDAIMATFNDGTDAITAAINLQLGISAFNLGRSDGGIKLKIGLHQGACIAVSVDRRLDYFGSMVNLAARLQGRSEGGDVIMSDVLVQAVDPRPLMPDGRTYLLEQGSAALRGFDQPVSYWRLRLDLDQDG